MENGLEWTSQSPLSTRGDIIRWWEARRYTFNAFLLAVGFASWLLVMTAGSAAVKPGDVVRHRHLCCDSEPCYTLGWVVDTVLYNGRPRTRLYKSGLMFAAVLSAMPGV